MNRKNEVFRKSAQTQLGIVWQWRESRSEQLPQTVGGITQFKCQDGLTTTTGGWGLQRYTIVYSADIMDSFFRCWITKGCLRCVITECRWAVLSAPRAHTLTLCTTNQQIELLTARKANSQAKARKWTCEYGTSGTAMAFSAPVALKVTLFFFVFFSSLYYAMTITRTSMESVAKMFLNKQQTICWAFWKENYLLAWDATQQLWHLFLSPSTTSILLHQILTTALN